MDRRKIKLLKYFLNNCEDGYKVIEVSKLFQAIKRYMSNFKMLEEDMDFLKKYKYIDVKYIDEVNICVCVLDNSYIFQENIKSNKGTNKKYILTTLISMIFSGVMAFLGAFIAVLLLR